MGYYTRIFTVPSSFIISINCEKLHTRMFKTVRDPNFGLVGSNDAIARLMTSSLSRSRIFGYCLKKNMKYVESQDNFHMLDEKIIAHMPTFQKQLQSVNN